MTKHTKSIVNVEKVCENRKLLDISSRGCANNLPGKDKLYVAADVRAGIEENRTQFL